MVQIFSSEILAEILAEIFAEMYVEAFAELISRNEKISILNERSRELCRQITMKKRLNITKPFRKIWGRIREYTQNRRGSTIKFESAWNYCFFVCDKKQRAYVFLQRTEESELLSAFFIPIKYLNKRDFTLVEL